MKKFYAVIAGEYSDFYIVAITDDKEKIEDITYSYTHRNRYYREVKVEKLDDIIQDGLTHYSVIFCTGVWSSGKLHAHEDFDKFIECDTDKVVRDRYGSYHVNVKAKDESHAIKIANGLIAQYKAQEAKKWSRIISKSSLDIPE